MCNVIQASKHCVWSYIWHHLSSLFVEQNSMTVRLEVTAPSLLAVLCNLSITLTSGKTQQRGSLMLKISRQHALEGVLCPWLLSQMTVLLASSLHVTLVWCGSCVHSM